MPTPYDTLNNDLALAVVAFAQSVKDKIDAIPGLPLLNYIDGLTALEGGYLTRTSGTGAWVLDSTVKALANGSNATGVWPISITGNASSLTKKVTTVENTVASDFVRFARIQTNSVGEGTRVSALVQFNNNANTVICDLLSFSVRQTLAAGNDPVAAIELSGLLGTTNSQVAFHIVQNTPTCIVDFYISPGSTNQRIAITELSIDVTGASTLQYTTDTWVSNAPAGATLKQRRRNLFIESTTPNDHFYYTTASGLASSFVSTLARSLLDDTTTTAMRTTLGLGTAATAASTSFQAASTELAALAALSGTGLIRKTAVNTYTFDTNTYLTANQSISISGDATGSGTTSISLTLANSGITAGTYTKVTFDSKGRATVGANLAAADIPTLDVSKITTGVFDVARLPNGSTTAAGILQLNNTVTSTSTSQAATANSVKTAYDLANSANATANAAIPATQKGAANGVAPLDANGKVPTANLPSLGGNGLTYLGTWNPSTNTPTLTATPVSAGGYYVVAGGSGSFQGEDYNPKDWIVSNGTTWDKVDNTDNVTSVAGKSGAVTLAKADVGLSNVDNTSDANKPVSTAQQTALNGKVDVVAGKQLSTEDYTTAEKTQLSGLVKQTGTTDATAGRLLIVGAFGLGITTINNSTDANAITRSGTYAMGTSWTGSPFAGTDARNAGTLHHKVTDATNETSQEFISEAAGDIKLFRVKRAGTYGAWSREWNTSNLTVSTTAPTSPYIGQLWVDTSGL